MAIKRNWAKLFEAFVADLRISSKEVVSQDPRGVPLVLWESQRRFMHEIGEGLNQDIHTFNCLKSRQLGITTVSLALVDVFWPAMHPNLIGCLVTDTEKNREANRALITHYVNSFPDGYFGDKFKIETNNRSMIKFSNGSRLDLLVAGVRDKGTSWGEGIGYGYAHLTETAAYGSVEGLKSLEEGFAQKNPHRLFVYESTAKGFGHWRTKWLAGLRDINQRSFFVGWWAGDTNAISRKDARFAMYSHKPEFEEKELIAQVAKEYGHKITAEQLAWVRWKRDQAGSEQELLDQNQPWTSNQAFVETGQSFFQVRLITKDKKRLLDSGILFKGYRYEVDGDFFHFRMIELDPERDNIDDVELKVWEEPVEDAKYVIGFDPAYGRNDHGDCHAIGVWRCFSDKIVQVAEFCTNDVETKHAAWVCFHLAAAYRDCMVNLEIDGPGALVMSEFDHLRQLLNSEVRRGEIQERKWDDAGACVRWYVYHRADTPGPGYQYNFQSNGREHPILMHNLSGAYFSSEIDIRSVRLLDEMANVRRDDHGHIGAPESSDENSKDDRVFALALALRAWLDHIRKELLAQETVGYLLTYEAVIQRGENPPTRTSRGVNNIVQRFLQSANEQADMMERDPPRGPKWRMDQGLI